MLIQKTIIPGCREIVPNILKDERGLFVKTFQKDVFDQNGLTTQFPEEYYTYSHQNVLRGLHFQVPPMDHVKVVYCPVGKVLDAIVDLRVGSPTYGKSVLIELSAEKANMMYLPAGLAHAFYVLSTHAILMYKVTTMYSPKHDTGILWDSAGIPWPNIRPIISKRDSEFVRLENFKSPFIYSLKE